jgi:diguanylate cyclase (GGDEF)-like protein/PAS domain S-box-containing protein
MDGSYRWVMQRCAVGLAVLDMGGEFLEANPAFCDLTGYSHDALSVPGFMFEKMLLTDEIASYRKHLVALSNGEEESYHQPQRIVRQDGAVLWVELTINLMRKAAGVPHGLVVTAVDITELRRTEGAFRDLSFRDSLTKLPNRRLLRDRLKGAVARARREERKVAVIFIDLDGFKAINDTQGHETGDWLLKAVAQRLSECLREYDTAARLGGDEFVVLLPDLPHSEDAAQVAERIRTALASPFVTDDKGRLEISASIGVSLFPDHAESARDLLQASDEAMYLAKKSEGNRVTYSRRLSTPTPTPVAVDEHIGAGEPELGREGSSPKAKSRTYMADPSPLQRTHRSLLAAHRHLDFSRLPGQGRERSGPCQSPRQRRLGQ